MDDGTLAYDTHLQERIPFSNPSDAKIARLALTHDVSLRAIDLFLQLLHDESFHSRDLTIGAAADIYTHVAQYRARRAETRASRTRHLTHRHTRSGSLALARVGTAYNQHSQTILNLILDELVQERKVLSRDPLQNQDELYTSTQTFLNMSYVHRSWTIPSQRALGKVASLNLYTDVRTILCNPVLGPWTTRVHIAYWCLDPEDRRGYDPRLFVSGLTDCAYSTRFILGRFSNLHMLSIAYADRYRAERTQAENSLDALHELDRLQELVVDVNGSCRLLSRVCSALPRLTNLHKLTLVCRSSLGAVDWDERVFSEFTRQEPSRSLRTVTFITDLWERPLWPVPYLEWIVRPRQNYLIDAFSLHVDFSWSTDKDIRNTTQLIGSILPCITNLTTLELHTTIPFDHNVAQHADFYRFVLSNCTNLRRLLVCDSCYRDEGGALCNELMLFRRVERYPFMSFFPPRTYILSSR